jgi:heme/copper-type cytochrome/quinol oxidase subunit 4
LLVNISKKRIGEKDRMNANEVSTIVFILSIVVSFSTVIVGLVPPQYAAITVAVFGVISEVINYMKSGYADKQVEPETPRLA